ncbi:tRNA preQ1(34) S-adenosylmethionine ribosyltransferase-isomerase QueA [Haliovirga abyssi]|uniref:S-adenosylmethionine:tRNA ribosyltransferase-isomerase n=1 Tax=Haliovirga abyssi TaxID=2996794 RepID=A0AAU9DPB1_9FUSO|nr:tRNA preQ1(34) S-adenosylmethionine ribosyltransferase-isomerase QueA [Haliovirga abyssi]BDU50248.1 S-adenosylmethionine:tRNA ribosyltransferase-isomerase [Haliovirga abyssi]
MKTTDFEYNLPEELIAQVPIYPRDSSRLMVVDKETEKIENKIFSDIIDYLDEGDLLVRNSTKVIPARLIGNKETGAVVEIFLLNRLDINRWECLVRPGKRVKIGQKIIFKDDSLTAKVIEIKEDGNRIVEFEYNGVFEEVLDNLGEMPLPPYIKEKLKDANRYQTVYAKKGESVAAPTAGLHFTDELLKKIKAKGIEIVDVFLEVGLGTFRPVKAENILEHNMHEEKFEIPIESANKINAAKKEGKRVIAVGTTSVRTLESAANNGKVMAGENSTKIFIYPGYKFKMVDALITNFHLPKSTLLMLVSAFSNRELMLRAYENAVDEKYRFFSFGDAMFIK